jgi:hypothetical protein
VPAHFSLGSVICATAERNSQREISVILRVTLAENRKLSATDDLTRVAQPPLLQQALSARSESAPRLTAARSR